jgi:hypothetical protein
VDGYPDDVLLVVSLIAAPIILCTLLYYGLTISHRRHHDADDEKRSHSVRAKDIRTRESI